MPSHCDRVEYVYRLGLPRAQQDLLLYLVHRAGFKTWRCKVGIAKIVDQTRLSRPAFFKARKALRESGLISWTQRRVNALHYEADEYLILPGGRAKNEPRGVGKKLNQKPTTTATPQRLNQATPNHTCRWPNSALHCTVCNAPAPTPSKVVAMFPEAK